MQTSHGAWLCCFLGFLLCGDVHSGNQESHTEVVVVHAQTGRRETFDVTSGMDDSFSFSVRVARRFEERRFRLTSGTSNLQWQEVLHSTSELALHATSDNSPAACVDPFWACERTNLPQPRGIAAAWYWPKALAGNTHPGASLPHGMVSVVAYSGAYPTGYGVSGHSSSGQPSSHLSGDYGKNADFASIPYQYSTTGFTHFQPSGTGAIANYMNYVKVMPLSQSPGDFLAAGAPWLEGQRSTLVGERAQPGMYATVLLEKSVFAEVTTAPGVALHRYTFQGQGGGRSVAVELSAAGLTFPGMGQPCQGLEASINDTAVEGFVLTPPKVGGQGAGLKLYFHLRMGSRIQSFWPSTEGSSAVSLNASEIAALGGSVGVVADAESSAEVRVGFSLHSLERARANVEATASFTFDEVADASWREWNDALSRISIEDDASTPASLSARNLFYSVLFHALRKPVDFTDHVPDDWTAQGRMPGYVFDLGTMWDQYKTTLPLILSVYPRMGKRLLNGLLNLARRFGEFPTGYTMDLDYTRFDDQARGLAHHTLADGLNRLYSLDWPAALSLMMQTFSEAPDGRDFVANGIVAPVLTHTLDLSGAAYATAEVARHLANASVEKRMRSLATNAMNAFNHTTCLLKNTSDFQFYEGTYMNYGFRPLPDMASRIHLCNSTAHFVSLMDAFFGYGREPAVQLPILPWQSHAPEFARNVSRKGAASHTFEGLCNEPDMETPYVYAYAGRADRVQEVVSAVKTYSFAPGRGGLAGNDDSGGEAAWYVWSSVGIFPVAGQPVYIIGSPSFASVSVHLGESVLRIVRQGSGAYIQEGRLNHEALDGRAWLWVHEAHAGGELVLTMGENCSSIWGTVPPPSFQQTSQNSMFWV